MCNDKVLQLQLQLPIKDIVDFEGQINYFIAEQIHKDARSELDRFISQHTSVATQLPWLIFPSTQELCVANKLKVAKF